MALTTVSRENPAVEPGTYEAGLRDVGRHLVVPGRIFFSLIFIFSGIGHFSREMIAYASQQGLPMAGFLVPFTGALAVLGGFSILFGYRARIGALLLIAFLVPVTLFMHNFWAVQDPVEAQGQLIHFLKNIAMLGAACLILYFGAGPTSFDEKMGYGSPTP